MTEIKEKKRGQKKFDHEALEVAFYANDRDFEKTSQVTGVSKNTLYQISKRRKWKTLGNAQRKLVEARQEIREIDPNIVTSVSEVVRTSFEDQKEGFKTSMSSALSKAGEFISTMPPEAIVAESRKVKDILDSGSKLYGFGEDGSKAHLSVNILGLSLDSISEIKPAIQI
jgi:vacuolar-type H+-ATPase subunit H